MIIYELHEPTLLASYAAGFQLSLIVSVGIASINKAVMPYYYEKLKKRMLSVTDILVYTKVALFLIVPIASCLVLMLPNKMFSIILGAGFSNAAYYSKVFMVGFLITIPYLVLVGFLFFNGENKTIAKYTVTNAVLYIMLLFIFIYINFELVPFALLVTNLILVFQLYLYVNAKKTDQYKRFAKDVGV